MDFMNDQNSEIYIHLLTIQEVFVYKIPPLKTASGHRAEDWNLASPLFTGCLKLSQSNYKLLLNIYSFKDSLKTSIIDENIQLFGQCPIEVKPGENILNFVDGVIDSSRYYVVRIKDPSSARSTLVGIGFRDREPSFDLKNCFNEYVKYINRMHQASQLSFTEKNIHESIESSSCINQEDENLDIVQSNNEYSLASASSNITNSTFKSYSNITPLKEGEKIKIKISKNNGKVNDKLSKQQSNNINSSLLRPPPPPGSTVHFQTFESDNSNSSISSSNSYSSSIATLVSVDDNINKQQQQNGFDDEWSEFTQS